MTRSVAEVVLQRGSYSKRSGGSGQDALASAGSCLNWGKTDYGSILLLLVLTQDLKKKKGAWSFCVSQSSTCLSAEGSQQ